MAPGEYVRIDQIAGEFGVSATPVREALLSLRIEGFVHLDRNRGFRVAPLSEQDVSDLFGVHAFVAGELAARAAKRVSPFIIEQLQAIQQSMKSAARTKDGDNIEELNYQFHRLINMTAASPKLNDVLRVLLHYAPRRFFAEIPGWPDASISDHAEIIDALKRQRPILVKKAMSHHILHGGELLVQNLRGRGYWAGREASEPGA